MVDLIEIQEHVLVCISIHSQGRVNKCTRQRLSNEFFFYKTTALLERLKKFQSQTPISSNFRLKLHPFLALTTNHLKGIGLHKNSTALHPLSPRRNKKERGKKIFSWELWVPDKQNILCDPDSVGSHWHNCTTHEHFNRHTKSTIATLPEIKLK